MKRDRMLELRVLTGTHAGARVLLPDAPQVLGSAEDCDLILCDDGIAPQHARLERLEDGSALLHVLDRDLPPIHIRPGQGAEVGQVRISVEEADAPWNEDVPIADQPPPPDVLVLSEAAFEGGDEAEASRSPVGTQEAQTPANHGARPLAPPRPAGGVWVVMGAGVLLAAGVVSYMAWTGAGRIAPTPEAGGINGSPAVMAQDAVEATIARLGLSDRVRVERKPGQVPMVHAGLLSPEDAEALGSALSRLDPRPGLRIMSQEDLQAAVVDALLRQSEAIERPLTSTYLGAGRFRVSGRVTDDGQRQTVLGHLATAVPDARGFDPALRTDQEASDAMLDDLRQHAALDIQGEWTLNQLAMRVRVNDATEMARWERALLAVALDHNLPFKATLYGPGAQKAGEALAPPKVRSVIGGPSPYVVLADGSKIMLEGMVGNLKLVEITPRAAIFASPSGQRATVER